MTGAARASWTGARTRQPCSQGPPPLPWLVHSGWEYPGGLPRHARSMTAVADSRATPPRYGGRRRSRTRSRSRSRLGRAHERERSARPGGYRREYGREYGRGAYRSRSPARGREGERGYGDGREDRYGGARYERAYRERDDRGRDRSARGHERLSERELYDRSARRPLGISAHAGLKTRRCHICHTDGCPAAVRLLCVAAGGPRHSGCSPAHRTSFHEHLDGRKCITPVYAAQ